MSIEVVYAEPARQRSLTLALARPATVAQALDAVRADPLFTGVDIAAHAVGVFGRVCALDHVLEDGDRVEIYRELKVDAKTARQRRAREQKER